MEASQAWHIWKLWQYVIVGHYARVTFPFFNLQKLPSLFEQEDQTW